MKILKKYPLLAGSLLFTTAILTGCGGGSDSTPKITELTLDIQDQAQVAGVLNETVGIYVEINHDYSSARQGVQNYYDHGHFLVDSGSAKWTYDDQTSILNIEFKNAQLMGGEVVLNGNIQNVSSGEYDLVSKLKAKNLTNGLSLSVTYQSSGKSDFISNITSSEYGSYKVTSTNFEQFGTGEAQMNIIGKDYKQWVLDFHDKTYTVTNPDGSSYDVSFKDGSIVNPDNGVDNLDKDVVVPTDGVDNNGNPDSGSVVVSKEFIGLGQGKMSSFIDDDDSDTVARLVDDGFTAIASVVKTFKKHNAICADGGTHSENYKGNIKVGNCKESDITFNGSLVRDYSNNYSNINLDLNYANTDEKGHLTANSITLDTSKYSSNYNYVDELTFVGQYSDALSNNQYVVLKSSHIYFDDQSFGLDYPKSGKILVSTGGKTWTVDLHGSTFDLTSPNGTTTQHTLSLMD